MTEESGSKEYDATPRKLEKARADGSVPIGQDVLTASAYAGVLISFVSVGESVAIDLGSLLANAISNASSASHKAKNLVGPIVIVIAPIFIAPMIAVLAALFAQNAFVVSTKRITPKLDRLSLIKNTKKKLGPAGLFEFAKSFFKLVVFSTILVWFGTIRIPDIIMLANFEGRQAFPGLMELAVEFFVAATVSVAVVGLIDILWQRSNHLRTNRMSRKELADETKDSEGDPHLKQARRQKAQDIASNRMLADVPKADVVITNPTHVSVALKWSRLPGSAPVCVAKGLDEIALRIREHASEANVPLFQDVPTARALYSNTEIGQEIHPDHYRAVAAAIRFSDRFRRARP